MAHWYVDSNAAGAGTGADWANAYVTLTACLAAIDTADERGSDVWVAHDHVESYTGLSNAGQAINAPDEDADQGNPCKIMCVNKAGTVPPVAADLRTTATLTVLGDNIWFNFVGYAFCYGITFTAGDGANLCYLYNQNFSFWHFKNCKLVLGGSHTGSTIQFPNAVLAAAILEDCQVKFAHISQSCNPSSGTGLWFSTDGSIPFIDPAGVAPNSLIGGNAAANLTLRGLDLSSITTGKGIFSGNNSQPASNVLVENCKLGSGGTVFASGSANARGHEHLFGSRVSESGVSYTQEKSGYAGDETTETTIVRTGGASDGVTPVARKIVTTAKALRHFPFQAIPIYAWNTTVTGTRTVTVEMIWGGGAVPNNDEIWIEVEYLSETGSPLSKISKSSPATPLTAASAVPAGSGTWGGSTTKFAPSVTISPRMIGPITVRVYCGKPSTTFYVDPLPLITA